MKTLEILRAARELLSDRWRWIQGLAAVDGDGNEADPNDADAARFCVLGGIQAAAGDGGSEYVAAAGSLEMDRFEVPDWNDAPERTHAEVLARFDAAIARLESQP